VVYSSVIFYSFLQLCFTSKPFTQKMFDSIFQPVFKHNQPLAKKLSLVGDIELVVIQKYLEDAFWKK